MFLITWKIKLYSFWTEEIWYATTVVATIYWATIMYHSFKHTYFNPHNNSRRYVILFPILHMRSLRLRRFKGLPKVTYLEVTKLGFEPRFPLHSKSHALICCSIISLLKGHFSIEVLNVPKPIFIFLSTYVWETP